MQRNFGWLTSGHFPWVPEAFLVQFPVAAYVLYCDLLVVSPLADASEKKTSGIQGSGHLKEVMIYGRWSLSELLLYFILQLLKNILASIFPFGQNLVYSETEYC